MYNNQWKIVKLLAMITIYRKNIHMSKNRKNIKKTNNIPKALTCI
jgi:hypothetical protein